MGRLATSKATNPEHELSALGSGFSWGECASFFEIMADGTTGTVEKKYIDYWLRRFCINCCKRWTGGLLTMGSQATNACPRSWAGRSAPRPCKARSARGTHSCCKKLLDRRPVLAVSEPSLVGLHFSADASFTKASRMRQELSLGLCVAYEIWLSQCSPESRSPFRLHALLETIRQQNM